MSITQKMAPCRLEIHIPVGEGKPDRTTPRMLESAIEGKAPSFDLGWVGVNDERIRIVGTGNNATMRVLERAGEAAARRADREGLTTGNQGSWTIVTMPSSPGRFPDLDRALPDL